MSRRGPERSGRPKLTLGRRLAVMAASALATLAIAVVVLVLWGLWTFNAPGPAAPHGAQTTVILRHGASVAEIAANLEDQGVVRSASIFMAAAQATRATRQLKAGEYAFPSRASLRQVLEMVRKGRIVRHLVTIPEGSTSEQVVAILMANDVLTGSAPVPAEGALLPETYEVVRGDDRAAVLQRMITAHDRLLAELWPHRSPDLPFTTPEEAVTLASIVEKETGLPAERPKVAAVFVNRLKQGIRLASDPTIIYGLTRGVPLGHGIRQSELGRPDAVQHLPDPGPAPDADLQSRPRLDRGGARPGAHQGPVFRRQRHGRPRLRRHPGRARPECAALARDRAAARGPGGRQGRDRRARRRHGSRGRAHPGDEHAPQGRGRWPLAHSRRAAASCW